MSKKVVDINKKLFAQTSFLLPLAIFASGSLLTFILANAFHRTENRSRIEQLKADTKEFFKNIELQLLNDALRLQSYLENFDIGGHGNSRKLSLAVEEILKTTVFQRASTFTVQKNLAGDGLPSLIRVVHFHTTKDPLPSTRQATAASIFLRRKIAHLQDENLNSAFAISHGDDADTLNLIWRSQFRAKEYTVMSTPITTVLGTGVERNELRAILTDPEVGLTIMTSWGPSGKPTVSTDPAKINETRTKLSQLDSRPLIATNSTIQIEWYAEAPAKASPFTTAILIAGLTISLLISLLLRFVMNQNRRIARLVVSRTEELESALNEAQEANLAKTRFLANMSHELRTPLNIIMGMSELLESKISDSKLLEFLVTMRSAGDHLLSMITDLLAMSREESVEIHIKSVPINTQVFIEEIGRLIGPDCRRRDLAFALEIGAKVPGVLYGDPARVRQILTNLLRNSVKYTNEGYVQLKVNLLENRHFKSGDVAIAFEVSDSGIGIPQNKRYLIFDRFLQLEGSKILAEGGVGLGLSIVKDLVEKMQGTITVQSEEKVGSTFHVELDFATKQPTPWLSQYESPQNETMRVLIACDNSAFLARIQPWLQDSIFEVGNISIAHLYEMSTTSTLQGFSKIIVDLTAEFDFSRLGAETSGKRFIFIGNEENFASDKIVEFGKIIDDCPLLPSRLLSALDLRIPRKRESFERGHKLPALKIPSQIRRPLSVLIADDDLGNQNLLRAYFEGLPWKVTFVTNGLKALEIYKEARPDLVIADLRMPQMDGFQLADEMHFIEKQMNQAATPVILVTADALEETARQAKKHAVTVMLTKPVRKARLLEVISEVMARENY